MMRRPLVAIAAFVALAAVATTIAPTATSARESTGTRLQLPCAATKPQKLRSPAPPPQGRENRRKPIYPPLKTLDGKPMW
jgi:hypothetical protein